MLKNWIKKQVAGRELAELARIKKEGRELAERMAQEGQTGSASQVYILLFPNEGLVLKLQKLRAHPESLRDLMGNNDVVPKSRQMHTAPRDGTPIWLVFHNGRAIRAHFSGGKGAWLHLNNGEGILPSAMAQVSGWAYLNERSGEHV